MNKLLVHIDSKTYTVEDSSETTSQQMISRFEGKNNKVHRFHINRLSDNEFEVWIKHHRIVATVQDEQSELLSKIQSYSHPQEMTVKSPMPGLVVTVEVDIDDEVLAGAGLVILEAMKMENEIKSPFNAAVKKINVKKGDKVEKGAELMVLERI